MSLTGYEPQYSNSAFINITDKTITREERLTRTRHYRQTADIWQPLWKLSKLAAHYDNQPANMDQIPKATDTLHAKKHQDTRDSLSGTTHTQQP